jgi:hypothetical protein
MALATHHGIAVGSMHPNGDSHAAEYAFYRGPRIGNSKLIEHRRYSDRSLVERA